MVKTLLLYDGKKSSSERIAHRLSYLIGNAKVTEMSEAPSDITAYGGFCFVFNFYGAVTAGKVTGFLRTHQEQLFGKRVALVGIGFSDLGFMNYVVNTEKSTGLTGIEGYFLNREEQAFRVGTEIGRMMQAPVTCLDETELSARIDSFVAAHNTLAMATSTEGYVRCTPMNYLYLDGVFYLITEGGNKFRGILESGRCSAAIFNPSSDNEPNCGVQIHAEAKILPADSSEYMAIMNMKGYTEEQLNALPVSLFLIKLIPLRYDYYNASLEQDGFDAHQILTTRFQKENWEAGAAFAESHNQKPEDTAVPADDTDDAAAVDSEPDETSSADAEEDDFFDTDDEMSAREAHSIIRKVAGDQELPSFEPEPEDSDSADSKESEDEDAAPLLERPEIDIDKIHINLDFLDDDDDDDDDDDFHFDGSFLDDEDFDETNFE